MPAGQKLKKDGVGQGPGAGVCREPGHPGDRLARGRSGRGWWWALPPRPMMWWPMPRPSGRARAATGSWRMTCRPATGIMGGTENAVTLIIGRGGRGLAADGQGRGRAAAGRADRRGAALSGAEPPAGIFGDRKWRMGCARLSACCGRIGPTGRCPCPPIETAGAAGADLRANLPPEDARGGADACTRWRRAIVPTGIRVAIPEGFEMQVRPRSGLASKHGITLPNTPGTIDSDYRGPLGRVADQPWGRALHDPPWRPDRAGGGGAGGAGGVRGGGRRWTTPRGATGGFGSTGRG